MLQADAIRLLAEHSHRESANEKRRWILAVAATDGGDCIDWPWSVNSLGYGQIKLDRQACKAYRLVCLLKRGDAMPGEEAAHTCDRKICCNPNHLRWVSRSENLAESGGRSKLSDDQIEAIFALRALGFKQREIAQRFGVKKNAISRILSGKRGSGRKTQAEREAEIANT